MRTYNILISIYAGALTVILLAFAVLHPRSDIALPVTAPVVVATAVPSAVENPAVPPEAVLAPAQSTPVATPALTDHASVTPPSPVSTEAAKPPLTEAASTSSTAPAKDIVYPYKDAGAARNAFIMSTKMGCVQTTKLSESLMGPYCECFANKAADMTSAADLEYLMTHKQTPSQDYLEKIMPLAKDCMTLLKTPN